MRAVLPVESVTGIGDTVDGRVRMLVGYGLECTKGLVSQTNPAGWPHAARNGRIQSALKRIAQILRFSQHLSTLRKNCRSAVPAANI